MSRHLHGIPLLGCILVAHAAQAGTAEDTEVCVEITLQDLEAQSAALEKKELEPNPPADTNANLAKWAEQRAESKVAKAEAASSMPPDASRAAAARTSGDQKSIIYLKRLMEHYVTHQKGYVSVEEGCAQAIHVDLYPLEAGWTAFVRYSGTGREERVDALFRNELSQFAERAVLAVLNDVPISQTINRENVLFADSKKAVQRVKGTNHYVIGLGTQLRGGMFDTAVDRETASEEIRIFSPLTIGTGYRGQFENWGLEALAGVGIGTSKTAARENPTGGHIDFGGDAALQIHFFRYTDPRGLISFYCGSGSTFELLWFSAIKAQDERDDESRSTLLSAGLDIDVVLGWEFMRASAVQFFLQAELNLPTYVVAAEDNHGSINTWMPGLGIKLGMVF